MFMCKIKIKLYVTNCNLLHHNLDIQVYVTNKGGALTHTVLGTGIESLCN